MKVFWMKFKLILILVLVLVALGSAATDDEIFQFSKLLISTEQPGLLYYEAFRNMLLVDHDYS